MGKLDYTASFNSIILEHFNSRITIIECESIVVVEVEYLDTVVTPSVSIEQQEIEILEKRMSLDRGYIWMACDHDFLLRFPYSWGIKPKDYLWTDISGRKDAQNFLRQIGRNIE